MTAQISFEHLDGLLIGFGALGSNIYSLCQPQGIFFGAIIDPGFETEYLHDSPLKLKNLRYLKPKKTFDFIAICVPDREVANVAAELAGSLIDLKNTVCFHTSGALGYQELQPLADKGASIGSWHPMMTFNREHPLNSLDGILCAIDGDDQAIRFLFAFSQVLLAKPLTLESGQKIPYHLLGVFVSNFIYALFGAAREISNDVARSGETINLQELIPMARTVLDNLERAPFLETVISGPVKRRDFNTIESHLKVLKKSWPKLIPLYQDLSLVLASLSSYSPQELYLFKKILYK